MKRNTDQLPLPHFFAETLRDTLDEWEVSQAEVSRMTGIPSPHLTAMKKSRRRCTPEYDLRFSRDFGTSPGFWLRLQLDYDHMRAEHENGEQRAKTKATRLIQDRGAEALLAATRELLLQHTSRSLHGEFILQGVGFVDGEPGLKRTRKNTSENPNIK